MVNNLRNILETVKENICRHKTGSCDPLVYVLSSNLPKVLTLITIRFNFLEFKIRDQFHFEVNARGVQIFVCIYIQIFATKGIHFRISSKGNFR